MAAENLAALPFTFFRDRTVPRIDAGFLQSLHRQVEAMMGASNLAARRGAKAVRRKAVLAQKRRAEAVETSLGAQAARAAALPIRCCLVSEDLAEVGMGTLVLARGAAVGEVFFSAFLLDTFALGVKNTIARAMEETRLESLLDKLNEQQPLVRMSPNCARRMLHKLVQWSDSYGFPPHRDYVALERLFGDVDTELCDCEYPFGVDGKPLYVNGPSSSLLSSRRVVERLSAEFGPDGFNYLIGSPQSMF